MPNIRIRRSSAPIKCLQTTLLKFDTSLPEPTIRCLTRVIEQRAQSSADSRYHIENLDFHNIHISETHCLDCKSRLVENGINKRLVVLDNGLGRFNLSIHRKRCKRCGEIQPNYSELAPKFKKFHENLSRVARQLYLEDTKPAQIRRILEITLEVSVSNSTIVRWLSQVKKPLRDMLKATPVPLSGNFGADEIFMRVGGEKMYQLDLVDLKTKFIPNAMVIPNMTRMEWRKVLTNCKFGKKGLIIKKIVKDGTINFGDLMDTHGFKHIQTQTCHTHLKWTISKRVKQFLGMGDRTKKPVPEQWQWLLHRFYSVLDASNETNYEIKLLIAGQIALKFPPIIRTPLTKIVEMLHSKKEQILAYCLDPNLDSTNNLIEGYHKKFERYSPFKRQMKTQEGAQYRSDCTRFKHNLERFMTYIDEFWKRIDEFKSLCTDFQNSIEYVSGWSSYLAEKRALEHNFGEYLRVWNEYYNRI